MRIRTSFSIDDTILKRIDAIAAGLGKTRSSTAEELMLDALGQAELTLKVTSNPVLMQSMMQVFTKPEILRAMMAEMRTEVDDDQLHLFGEAMQAVSEIASKPREIKPSDKRRTKAQRHGKGKK